MNGICKCTWGKLGTGTSENHTSFSKRKIIFTKCATSASRLGKEREKGFVASLPYVPPRGAAQFLATCSGEKNTAVCLNPLILGDGVRLTDLFPGVQK